MSKLPFQPLSWSRASNVYEINLRQYSATGNFAGFRPSLPRLRDMGIEVLWFMPVTPISQKQRKGTLGSYYASADFFSVNPEFGNLDEFISLVEEAHQLGFKVIIDWVANHTGWDHTWTSTHPAYYKRNEAGNFFDSNGWDDVIDLDFTNPEMRRAMIEAMRFWVKKCNIDGFRCDMAMLVPLDFWIDARTALDQEKALFWLAECEEPHYHDAFDLTYTWEWMHKTVEFMKGQTDLNGLESLLWKYNHQFPPGAMRLYFTTNHDENSWNGTEFEKYGEAHQAFAVFSATWNGVPLIYSGQEQPNQKRLKFFDRDPIQWTAEPQYTQFYQKLLTLRRGFRCMEAGADGVYCFRVRTTADQHIFAFLRTSEQDQVLVMLNLSPHDGVGFGFLDAAIDGSYEDVFEGGNYVFHPGYRYYQLGAWGYKVFALYHKS
ncbi:alpha-amylase family glycosyl hydrolase [Flavihumibacter sp. CACIAM 22H1]|uniref:alpha-amylase family glycosyl hydrolase n=1 Tax=Flavihumibacter sp. CACIAM 22H1 TaxID=1812911 RepID=UPI0007A87CAB|nr:alpha-amylase family glycosyl hydrolase [Flavihumibacter sp. CACIAM 22H1]KYP14675.1 MAG: hypothetical protein A1D16_09760 [Flavihumibacter sp. CACIAM 22H1]